MSLEEFVDESEVDGVDLGRGAIEGFGNARWDSGATQDIGSDSFNFEE